MSTAASKITSDPLVSDEARWAFQWIGYGVLCLGVDLFGTVTNIINIICFVKQGFNDPVNVSLLGLSISDLGCVVTLIWSNICFMPAFQESHLITFDSIDVQFLTAGWIHVMFTRITSWITALITMERCLCIAMPLQVKNLITPKRVMAILICVFTIFIGGVAPVYYINRLGQKFSPGRNNTVLGLIYSEDRSTIEPIFYALYNLILPFTAFLIVIVFTIALVVELRKKAEWRMKCTTTVSAGITLGRDQKVAKMVAVISGLFIACFMPLCLTTIAMIAVPGMTPDGLYVNTLFILGGISMILESTNSATNIFVYYFMSSRYRFAFHELFKRPKKPWV